MASAWWNLGLRFLLELAAVAGFAIAGWRLSPPPWHWVAAVALPVVAVVIWGVFNVPGDPSRSGAAPVPVPGVVRLLLELAILVGGAFALWLSGYRAASIILAVLIVAHYLLSIDRIAWLLRR